MWWIVGVVCGVWSGCVENGSKSGGGGYVCGGLLRGTFSSNTKVAPTGTLYRVGSDGGVCGVLEGTPEVYGPESSEGVESWGCDCGGASIGWRRLELPVGTR